ncbi:hypothetical protein BH11ARM2_BH11ARM2_27530 [soil metagenome]
MKGREVPQGVLFGVVAVVLVIILGFAYTTFLKATPQTDPTKLSPQQLQDPDPPRTVPTHP